MTAPSQSTPATSPQRARLGAQQPGSVVTPGFQLGRSLKAEARKVLSLRSAIVWAILFTGCLYGMPFLMGTFAQNEMHLSPMELVRGDAIFTMLAVIFGASSIGREYAYNMHAHNFLTQKSRWHWIVSRYIVLAVYTAVMFVLGTALAYLVTMLFPKLHVTGGDWSYVWLVLMAMPIFTLIGAGAAAVFRNRIAGIALPLVWFLVIEGLLQLASSTVSAAKIVAQWSPGNSVQNFHMAAMDNAAAMGMPEVNVGQSVAALLLWLVVWTVGGVIVNQKRDVR